MIEVEGADVPVYRLQNLTESQRNFLLLVHSESYKNAKQYYQREFPGISLSALDDKHLQVFTGGIIFGYDDFMKNTDESKYNEIAFKFADKKIDQHTLFQLMISQQKKKLKLQIYIKYQF